MTDYIDFYWYGDASYEGVGIVTPDRKACMQKLVRETIAEDLSFTPNGETIDVILDGNVIGNFRIPDEAAFENASYDKETKTIKFTYDQNGVEGEKTVDLSDLSDVYNGENGISVSDKSISVKYDEDTMELTESGALKAKSDNLWGTI